MSGLSVPTPKPNSAELAWATVLGESIANIAWLPSGELLLAGTADGELCGYQTDAECQYLIQAYQRGLAQISPSPTGKTIATTGVDSGVLRLFNLGQAIAP
jgi:WD40 repeat protein